MDGHSRLNEAPNRSSILNLMKHVIWLLCILSIDALTSPLIAQTPPSDAHRLSTITDVDSRLREFIKKQFPKAAFSVTKDTFVAKADTMTYTVHNVFRGTVSEKTHREEGPLPKGFVLRIEHSTGKYGGPTFVPSTHREPYWNTTLNDIVDDNMDTNLWVVYSWGREIDKHFHRELQKRLHCRGPMPIEEFNDDDMTKEHGESPDASGDPASCFDNGISATAVP